MLSAMAFRARELFTVQVPHRVVALVVATLAATCVSVTQFAPASEAASAPLNIVVIGDSYSAGNGAGDYFGPDGCYRSTSNWPARYRTYLANSGRKIASFQNTACSGAVTADFWSPKKRNNIPANGKTCVPDKNTTDEILHLVSPNGVCTVSLKAQSQNITTSTNLVMFTFGGNDAGFASIVADCFVYKLRSACRSDVEKASALMKSTGGRPSTLQSRLVDVMTGIKHQMTDVAGHSSPDAHIIYLGYPPLIGTGYSFVLKGTRLDGSDSYDAGSAIRQLQADGEATQIRAVNAANSLDARAPISYVTATPKPDPKGLSFVGHEPDPRGVSLNSKTWLLEAYDKNKKTISYLTWYHPNPTGHEAFKNLLVNALGALDSVPTPGPITPPPGSTPTNKAPVAGYTWSRMSGANNPVALNGASSSDPDGTVTSWHWTSGSKVLGNGKTLTTNLGTGFSKSVTLTVTDNLGKSASTTKTLSLPNRAPTLTAPAPANGSVVGSNQPTLSVSARDDDGDAVTYSYRVVGNAVDVSSDSVGGAWAVPAHRLDPGQTYTWSVTAKDGHGGTSNTLTQRFTVAMLPTAADVISTPSGHGYWQVASDGGVFSYGDAQFYGSVPGIPLRLSNIMGMARTPSGRGYWIVGRDGGVYAFGDAPFVGSVPGLHIAVNNIVGMVPTKTGNGYWLAGSDGGVFSFGDAPFYGSMGGKPLNAPVDGISASASGRGYWLVARDGGVFSFGDAPFYGSKGGQPLNAPIVDMDVTPDGGGYWMTAEDGGVFAFGNAPFYGSMAGKPLNGHVTGMATTPSGAGYWLNACDGGVFTFGDAPFFGSNATYQCRGVG